MNTEFKYIVQCFLILFVMIGFGRSVESLPRATDYPVALFGLDGASALLPVVVGLGAASRAGKWSKKIGCFAADTPVAVCDPKRNSNMTRGQVIVSRYVEYRLLSRFLVCQNYEYEQ